MNLPGFRLNIDALLARVVYRWRGRVLLALLLLASAIGLGNGVIPPLWRGPVTLAIHAAPGATVRVDGRPWPHALYAGAHTVVASLPDGRSAWADVTMRAGEALTLTLPTGLHEPRIRSLPPPAPGMQLDQVWWADGSWRARSVPRLPPPVEGAARHVTPTPTLATAYGQTIAIGARGAERLPTLDVYTGLADQAHVAGRRIEAVFQAERATGEQGDGGTVVVRGWSATPQTYSIAAPLALLRFAPNGAALLIAEQAPGGEQVSLLRPTQPPESIVAVPGHIVRLTWRDDSSAVVLHSVQDARLTLTVALLRPGPLAAVIAEVSVEHYAGAIVPLAWEEAGLRWVAPNEDGVGTLWRASLATLMPEHTGPLDARAITILNDGALRAVVVRDTDVVIGRVEHGVFIGEAIVPSVPPAADLMGIWQGSALFLQSSSGAWLVDVVDAAARQGG